MNTRFIARALIILLALTAVGLTAFALLIPRLVPAGPSFGTPPPPASLVAPHGELPAAPVGLEEWTQYRGQAFALAGSGFFLCLSDGQVVGVTTAHSVWTLGLPDDSLERIAFAIAGQVGHVAEFDTLYGTPGTPRASSDLTQDYVLLKAGQSLDAGLVLTPDPRGRPQAGERVSLFSGLGDGRGGVRQLAGTVQSVDSTGIWVLMDETFDPSRMSGSPLLSQHTGRVVGMAIASAPRGDRLYLGFNPIASIVQRAEAATEFPKIAGYRR